MKENKKNIDVHKMLIVINLFALGFGITLSIIIRDHMRSFVLVATTLLLNTIFIIRSLQEIKTDNEQQS